MTIYKFGPHLIKDSQVFYKSKLTLGIVNLKPIAPLHDLSDEEIVDFMLSAQKIGRAVEKHYQGTSLTMTIQDGPQAGQTVPHVHMHLIPRKKGDWANNDDVYEELDKSKGVDNEGRPPRTEEDMKQEADELRVYF
ncbi:hypothetical protein G6F43_012757 [Rhizopus delemar]|nr:hypothetical protein G6F43_012757 [Rhizopus delemar]